MSRGRKIPRVPKVSNPDLHSVARASARRLAKASKVRSPSLVNQGIQFASLLNDGGKSKAKDISMPKTKSGKLIPYNVGGAAADAAAKNTTFTKRADAEKMAADVGGTVVSVDTDDDGVIDSYNVVLPQSPGKDEEITSRPPGAEAYIETGEGLGYMHGGMKEKKRGPVKYSVGGAIKGKNFAGSF